MAGRKAKAATAGYKIISTYPGREFSKADQQRIAAQIARQLALHIQVQADAGENPQVGKRS